MKEIVQLTVTKYTTKDGVHTCALNFETGEVCSFYRTQRFGTYETCLFAETDSRGIGRMLKRRDNEGYLIPDKNCPIVKGTFDGK